MKLRTYIVDQVRKMPFGKPFDFGYLDYPKSKSSNVAVILHDLKLAGELESLGKGVFYRPEVSQYGLGKLPVYQEALFEYVQKKYNAHIAGPYIYSRINITEQVAVVITLATPVPERPISFGMYNFVFEKCDIGYVEEDKLLVAYLDALKNVERIPGCTPYKAFARIKRGISNLDASEKDRLCTYALSYPSRVKVSLAAALEAEEDASRKERLLSEVHPSTIISMKNKTYLYETA